MGGTWPAPPVSICCDRAADGKHRDERADEDGIPQRSCVDCVLVYPRSGSSPEREQEIDPTQGRAVVQRSETD